MRLLLDNNLSARVADFLTGHVVDHVRSVGLGAVSDDVVLAHAATSNYVLVSADTDFGHLLAASQANSPSVILVRRQNGRRAAALAKLLLMNLPAVEDDPRAGAIVVIGGDDIRIRRLPILPGS